MTSTAVPMEGSDPVVRLADRLAGLRWQNLPAEVQHRTVAVMTDTVAAAALGSRRSDVRRIQDDLIDGTGPSTVIGRGTGAPVAAAAAANAAAVTAHQLQDGHRRARGHPGSHAVPAALAVAEAHGAAGPQLLLAVLAGYEAAVRLSLSMGGTRPGVHDIGSWGSVGASVAVAHLLSGGAPETIATAIRGAASLVLLTHARTVFDGYGMQHLFLAEASRLGLAVGRAAAAGTTAHPGALEHVQGHVAARWTDLADEADREPWHFEILEGYIKRHPTCAYLHGVNDAVESILATHGGVTGHAVSATVRTFRAATELPSEIPPANALTARFNIPWTLATALSTGQLGEDSFGDDNRLDPQIARLAREITVLHDEDLDVHSRAGRPAHVEVRLDDGRLLTAEVYIPFGDGRVPKDLVETKAERILAGRFGAEKATHLIGVISRLGAGTAVSELTRALREGPLGTMARDVD